MTLSFSSLSGGTSFTVVTSTGGSKTATLDKSYPAGTYLIESKANDTNLEIYLGASDGTQVGTATAGAKTITASASFLYVTTVNADANDAVIFTLKSAATLATKTDAVWAPPTITDITPSGLPNANDTTTITGTNFATNVDVKFRKSDDSTLVNAKTTVRGSATSIIATRPDSFSPTDSPYDVIVTNPSTNLTATSLNAITAGAVPVWVTSTTLNTATSGSAFSQTIQATDSDGGSSITYAIVSGAFPTGLSLNTSTGAITGTPTGAITGTYTITISATDSGGNTVNRTFSQTLSIPAINGSTLVVAGGGGGANGLYFGGGGGAGGLVGTNSVDFVPGVTYTATVGAGGTQNTNGINSNITGGILSLTAAVGGGYGGASQSGNGNGGNGGSGGGGQENRAGGTGTPGQGNNGGSGDQSGGSTSGGGGGAGAAGSNGIANNNSGAGGVGSSSYSSWGAATSSGQNVSGTYYFAGGAGGSSWAGGGNGGAGGYGGGAAGVPASTIGNNGTANTGGGGSSAATGGVSTGGSGGSGIIIIRYPGSVTATSTTGSPTRYETGGYTYYKFTANGTITL
jgi:hypothetical protein